MGWFSKLLGLHTVPHRTGTVVIQKGSRAGGRQVRGDYCGGNMKIRGVPAEGSYIGGNLTVDWPSMTVEKLRGLNLEVGGRVILNGEDVTDQFRT